jgi:hypothetical protein
MTTAEETAKFIEELKYRVGVLTQKKENLKQHLDDEIVKTKALTKQIEGLKKQSL